MTSTSTWENAASFAFDGLKPLTFLTNCGEADLQKGFAMNQMIGIPFAASPISTAAEAGEERFALRLVSEPLAELRLPRADAVCVPGSDSLRGWTKRLSLRISANWKQ